MTSLDEPSPALSPLAINLNQHMPPLVVVRNWTAEALADLSEAVLGDVLLVVTELVSNAYDHGWRPLQLRLLRRPFLARIEVDDTSPQPPVLTYSSVRQPRGRGLVLVDHLSTAWGVAHHAGGKTVWAEIPCEPL
jgi:anti-sigma regulatory factor (Ser/Thr protein kinase)